MNDNPLMLQALLAEHPEDDLVTHPSFEAIAAAAERRRWRQRVARGSVAGSLIIALAGLATWLAQPQDPQIEAASPMQSALAGIGYLGPSASTLHGSPRISVQFPEDIEINQSIALADPHQPDGRIAVVNVGSAAPGWDPVEHHGEPISLGGVRAGRRYLPTGGLSITWRVEEGYVATLTAIGFDDAELAAIIEVVSIDPDGGATVAPVHGLAELDPSDQLTPISEPAPLQDEPDKVLVELSHAEQNRDGSRGVDAPLSFESSTFAWWVRGRLWGQLSPETIGGRDVMAQRGGGRTYVTWWDPAGVGITIHTSVGFGDTNLARLVAGIETIGPDGWDDLLQQGSVSLAGPPSQMGNQDAVATTSIVRPEEATRDIGPVEQFEVGSVTVDDAFGQVAISRPDAGTVVAVVLREENLASNCEVLLAASDDQTFDPGQPALTSTCSDAIYDLVGDCVGGSCRIGLSRVRAGIIDGRVVLYESDWLQPRPRDS